MLVYKIEFECSLTEVNRDTRENFSFSNHTTHLFILKLISNALLHHEKGSNREFEYF